MAALRSSLIAIPRDNNLSSQVDFSRFGSKLVIFKSLNHQKPLVSRRRDTSFTIKASIRYSSSSSSSVAPPLKLESPIGQFLSEMLKNHPHLVHAAVEQQLEQLQTDDDPKNDDELEPLLYKRIAEVKANQREKALEEILYTIVVQKFNDANAPLIPNIIPSTRIETWPNDQNKLFQLHSPESYEMINNHLSHILGDSDYDIVAEINKARIGQVYAASAIYGYFLRRVDERYQMDKKMTIGIGHDDFVSQIDTASRLKKYVASFNKETLQSYAKIRSKEAVSIIEKHTAALFGRAKVAVTTQGTYDDCSSKDDEKVDISFGDFRTLILEGLTFGSFLWDAESYVDMKCNLVAN